MTFYDPVSIALNGARLQDFVSDIFSRYNELNVPGFTFNEQLLPNDNYEQVEDIVPMEVMANYVDPESPAIPVSRQGKSLHFGKIPRMKSVEYYNEAKLRELSDMQDRRSVSRSDVVAAAQADLGEIFLTLIRRHTLSLNYQRGQMVSNAGLELTSTNNPYGLAGVKFPASVPVGNKTTLLTTKRWWTDHTLASEGNAADPIADLKKMAKTARDNGISRFHFEVNDAFLDDILGHSKVVAAIAARLWPLASSETIATANVSLLGRDKALDALSGIVGAPVVPQDVRVSTESVSGGKPVRTQLDGFNKYVVVLVPDGKIGEILTVKPMLLNGGDYAFAYGRKLAITIGKDYVKKCLSYNSEMTSLIVPTSPRYMWYLFPCEA